MYDLVMGSAHLRAAIEDAYAKSLSRLSKSTLGSQEEG